MRSILPALIFPFGIVAGTIFAALPGQTADRPTPGGGKALHPADLRCEYLVNPQGIDETAPRMSWRLAGDGRGLRQSAYRVLVASSPELLAKEKGDLWDSGKVSANTTTGVVYAGKPLTSRTSCYWKVRAWDQAAKGTPWSEAARWSMGLLAPQDWQAEWISFRDRSALHVSRNELHLPPPRYYRHEFQSSRPIKRATLYSTALGLSELRLNGERIGDAAFTPGWADYRERAFYNTFDVTSQMRRGANTLGAIVAEGWYSGYVGYGLLVGYGPNRVGKYFYGKTPALRAQLEIEYADGGREQIMTGPHWRVTDRHPIREADILMGETYDARMELVGWDRAGFDASGWENAIPARDNGSTKATFFDSAGQREVELGFVPPKRLQAYPSVPIRATGELKVVRVTEPAPKTYIFDLGQNFSGIARLKYKGPGGRRIQLRFGEMLFPDGRLMTDNLRRARATDTYITKGTPEGETWQPGFTYHGFQYVEVTGLPGKPEPDAITGVVLHSDTPLTSAFECSDPVINRLYQNVVWTQRANFFEIPTDCPQRDERLGWTGDAQIYVRAATYHADVSAFFTKWMQDLVEAQRESGAYPDYAPYPMYHGGKEGYGTAWTDAGIICPYTIYQVYGDTRILERCYPSMVRFMEFRKRRSPDLRGVKHGNTWGDWLALGQQTPIEYVDAAYFAYSARLMSEIAAALGKAEDTAQYRKLFEDVRGRYQADYIKPDGSLSVDTQTAYALALWVGLLPEKAQTAAGTRLAAMIRANGGRMATGFLGTRPLLPVLTGAGQHEMAVQLLQSRQFPSWGYEVVNGATSIWERWNSYTKDKGFGDAGMNSFSHYSFGAVSEWMFQSLAGIDTDGPGFRKIVLRPGPATAEGNPDVRPVHWVKAEYRSQHGPIATRWKRENGKFELEATVPPNTTATLYLPARQREGITESGKPVEKAAAVRFVRMEGDRAVFELGSGQFSFVSSVP